jgi:hypothetical protein
MSKRSRRRDSARRKARRATRQPSAIARQEPDFRDEYRYVLADLKRIGGLAAVMVAALVALSFLLP